MWREYFPDGECLHATIKYVDQCISSTPIKPKNLIHIKFALGFYDKFTKYIIPDEELDCGQNTSLIHFSVYIYQFICAKHGIITNGPTLFKLCESNDDINNGLIKRPTCVKKKDLTKFYVLLVIFTWYIIIHC